MHSTQVFAVGLAILTIGLAASSAHAASIVAAPGADAQAALSNALPGQNQTPTVLPTVNALIPEPTSWTLMIAGFGLAGLALRRRAAAAA